MENRRSLDTATKALNNSSTSDSTDSPSQAASTTVSASHSAASNPAIYSAHVEAVAWQQEQSYQRDALTGLHGQAYLCQAIDECLRDLRQSKLTATLALLQLENFYEIRSWVGLSEADLLLSDIAQLLRASLPDGVLLCRCHNYEFAALMLGDCSVNARRITDKLKLALLSAVSPSIPRQLELQCGVGLAKLESNIPSWPVVFARARHNLRLAHYHRELPADLVTIAPDLALKQLHRALQASLLELTYQATGKLEDCPLKHYEVRCTLAQDEHSLPTILLFETAARNALGELIDRRIIEQVLETLTANRDADLRLLINLSHNSIVSGKFLDWLSERLGGDGVASSRLVMQISETDALVAQHHLRYFCELIEKLGCKISISNFGCTPNPLRYLSLVPANYVKLDSGLLTKIDINQSNLDALKILVKELHQRKISVIAPLVEQLSLLPLLWQSNIDYFQGHCLHRPATSMQHKFVETRSVSFQ